MNRCASEFRAATPAALDPRAPDLGLWRAVAIFSREPSGRVLAAMLVGGIVVRCLLGPFSIWDGILVAALVAIHPLTEWLMHVYVLHFRPRTIGGRHVDFMVSRYHRLHHVDPYDPTYWFIPARSGAIGFGIVAAVAIACLPSLALAFTMIVTGLVLGLLYEWTHYLCHTSYRPRSRFYRGIWRHHRLHHFKNERYWMGVSMHMGDRLLGTMPRAKDVELSPTCRNLYERDSS